MNTTREVVAPGMRAAAEDVCGDEAERVFTADTRELMGFFMVLRRLMLEVSCAEKRATGNETGRDPNTGTDGDKVAGWDDSMTDVEHCSAASKTSPFPISTNPVSYTHLTLPTKRIV